MSTSSRISKYIQDLKIQPNINRCLCFHIVNVHMPAARGSHPKALGNARQRFDAIVTATNPPDPFAERPEIGQGLRAALRG